MFVFVIYNDKFGICSQERWNAKNGYLPDDKESHAESLEFVKLHLNEFYAVSECMFKCKSGLRKSKKILIDSGLVKVNFGVKL